MARFVATTALICVALMAMLVVNEARVMSVTAATSRDLLSSGKDKKMMDMSKTKVHLKGSKAPEYSTVTAYATGEGKGDYVDSDAKTKITKGVAMAKSKVKAYDYPGGEEGGYADANTKICLDGKCRE